MKKMHDTLDRREMLALVAGGSLARFRSASSPPPYSLLKNVDFFVSDEKKFGDFYAAIFGSPVRQPDGKLYVYLGGRTYMQVRTRPSRGADKRLDCLGLGDTLELPKVLKDAGIPFERRDD